VDDTGEAAVDSDSDGEFRTSREPPVPLPEALPPACGGEDKLAREEAKRGLPVEVTARERLPLCNCPLARPDPAGEASELVDEVDDCRLVTWRLAAAAAWFRAEAELVGEKAARSGLSLEVGARVCPELAVDMGVRPRREVCLLPFHAEF
jgi:hypothetical protein